MRAHCPKESSLVGLFMGEAAPRETEKLLRHLASCRRCSFRFNVLRQVKRDLHQQVDAFADSRDQARGVEELREAALQRMGGTASSAASPPPPPARHWPLRTMFGIRFAFGLIALVMVLTSGTYFVARQIRGHSGVRSPFPRLTLLAPTGTISDVPASFRWTPVTSAENYILELIDDSLRPIYATSTFVITEAAIPREIKSGLVKGRTYVWSVTARDGSGTLLASRSGSFVVK